MSTPAKYVQTNTLYLSGSGVIVGATSIILTSLTDIYGNVLTMADFGSKGYGTLEPDTTNEEAFTFTGITANVGGTYTLTGVASALAKSPYTETSGLVRSHSGGTKLVISDNAAFWNGFANKANDEVITGSWSFNTAPVALSATRASTSNLGNVKLSSTPLTNLGTTTITIASPAVITLTAHGLIAGDSVQFTTTGALPTGFVAGVDYYVITAGLTANAFELAATVGGAAINTSGSQSGVHTLYRTTPFAIGNDDPRVNNYAADAGSTDAYAITLASAPAAYVTGQTYLFKANTSNTGACTLNVNSLGAKTIKKNKGDDLVNGDIIAGQIISATYDGTNFQIVATPSVDSFNGDIDQSQVTQDGSFAVGEANATTKKNKLAQSFIPTHGKMRGIRLYKAANTGTFTGTVTVALQADSAGSPSGVNLASQTMTNATYLAAPVGAIEFAFTSEYDLVAPSSTYWIVVSTSTSDNANHPNLGMITAGAYANGVSKYNNTTDGWVSPGAQDLWFQTLIGWNTTVVSTDTIGNIPGSISPLGVIDIDTTQTTVNTTNTETTVYTRTLPNNTFSANSGIWVKVLATVQFDAAGHQVQFRLKLNGNLIGVSLLGGNSTGAQSGILTWVEFWVMNNNSLSVQKAITTSIGVKPTQTADGAVSEVDVTAYAVDTSAAQNILTVTIQPSVNNASLGATNNAVIVSKIGL